MWNTSKMFHYYFLKDVIRLYLKKKSLDDSGVSVALAKAKDH